MSVYSVPSLVSIQENLIDQVSSFVVFPSPVSMEDPVLDNTIVKLIVEGAGLDYGPRRL
jgi:hypothetical protein